MGALIDDITLGRFVPGNSFLHRLDPRFKLAGLPILVIAAFAAHTAGQFQTGPGKGERMWRALLRKLDRIDPSYRN